MNGAQLHFLVNHFPVILPVVGAGILGVALPTRSEDGRRTGLWLLFLSGIFAGLTYFTGDPARDVVMNYPGISRDLIENHRAAALQSSLVLGALSLTCLPCLYASHRHRRIHGLAWTAVFAITAVSFALVARAAHLGGEIHHEEIRNLGFAGISQSGS